MEECKDCEYRGYSPQLCRLHARHCRKNKGRESKPRSSSVKIGAKTLAGAGVGMAVVLLGSAAVSLVGSAVLVKAALIKIGAGAGLTGGGIGLIKAIKENQNTKDQKGADKKVPD